MIRLMEEKGHSPWHKEEKWNTVSHAIGVLFAFVGLYFLQAKNDFKSAYATEAISAYSITLILMFSVSAAYHFVSNGKWKDRLRILDHISIYFLIAGTYTPVTLILLEKGNGWTIFYAVWAIALIGTVLKLFFTGKFEAISLLLYVAMGWMIVLDFTNLMDSTSKLGIQLLFTGGAFYTLGIIFYAWEKIPYNHFIWHLFVLGGAISHWFFIYSIV